MDLEALAALAGPAALVRPGRPAQRGELADLVARVELGALEESVRQGLLARLAAQGDRAVPVVRAALAALGVPEGPEV